MLRSGDRPGVEQELWALLTVYQLLRTAMVTAVETRPGTNPDRASFTTALEAAREELPAARGICPAGSPTRPFPPEHARAILAQVKADITKNKHLNPRRRHRTCPRVIKRGRHNFYRVKKPGDKNIRHDGPATIRLANPVLTSTAA